MNEAGVTQTGLERATKRPQPAISLFFTKQRKNPSLEFMDALARVFSHTLADLLADELPEPTISRAERDLLAVWRTMSGDERKAFERLIRRRKSGARNE